MSFSIGSNTAVNKDVGSGLWTQNSMNKYDQCQQIYDQEVKQRQHFILQLRAKRYASNPRNTLQTTTAQQTKYNNKTQNSLKTSNNYNNMYNLKFKDWVSNSTNSNKLNASYIGNSAEVTVEDQQSKRYFPKIQGTNSQFEAEGFEILELQKETDQNFQEQQNLHNTTQKKYSYFMEHQHKNKDNQHSRQSTNTYQQRVNQTKTMLSNINKRLKNAVCIKPPSNTVATVNTTTGNSTLNNLVASVLDLQLTTVPGVLVGFYATEVALNSIIFLLLLYFGRLLPRDFAKMGRIMNCSGALLKIFPKLIILLHYVIIILILVVIGQVGSGTCKNSQIINKEGLPEKTKLHENGIVLISIISPLWILMHFGGTVIRSMLYVDPFLLDPYDPKGNRFYRILCQTCGP
eukprot:403369191